MKKFRLIIYILFFTFNIALFLFTLYIETFENIFELGSLILPKIPYMKYGAVVGVILVIIDFVIDKAEKKALQAEISKIESELNATKAKLYDMQSSSSTIVEKSSVTPSSDKSTAEDVE